MKTRTLVLSALVAFGSAHVWAQTNNISSVGITTGVVTVTARIGPNAVPGNINNLAVGNTLAGLAYAAGNIPGASDTSISFFTLTGTAIPGGAGNPLNAFMSYGTLIGPPSASGNYPDVAPLLTANSYLGLTFAATNLYPGGPAPLSANGFYMIHRNLTNGTDYLAGIVPATGGGSAVLDIKPMAWTGGVAATGASVVAGTNHYFALTFAVPTPAGPYFANNFYYLRTDASSHTQFGYVIPALTSGFLDTLDLNTATGGFGATGYTTLAFSATAIGGYAVNQFYYLRLDAATGNTILGRLDTNPANRTLSDIANLGGVYSGLTFAAEATGTGAGWGSNQLYATGTRALTAQSVSFAAIADRTFLGDVPFVVTPSASSGLDLVVTVVSGPATVVTTGPALSRVHTVTTTGPGVVKLRATQAGPGFDTNYLEQSFNVLGLPSITSAATASATAGTPFTFNITATGAPIISYAATALPTGLTLNTTTGVITGTPTVAASTIVTLTATNATGTSLGSTLTITVAAASVAPNITNSPLTAAGTVGTAFSFTITATGSPTSYAASPLPAGLVINTATGVISGTPTAAGTTAVLLGATNGTGTDNATLTITVGAAGVAPNITNSPLTAAGTVGTAFSFTITATGSPTSYAASPLPAGLVRNATTGVISGTPTAAGTTAVTLGATNAFGTDNATLTITVGAAGVAPNITNSPLTAAGTVGTAFSFTITATGSPTSYAASPLPAGLVRNATTGVISGTPTAAGSTSVTLGATNAFGTDNATLTITVAAGGGGGGAVPVVNSPITASGTVGTPFNYAITATNSPTSYAANVLPAGLSLNSATGVISGTPTSAGSTAVLISATNSSGTSGTQDLTVTIAIEAVVTPPVTPPTPVPPAILAVLPVLPAPAPVNNWQNYQPAQITVAPVPGLNATFDMTYHQEGVFNVGVGRSVIPGESLVTVASGNRIDLIVSLLDNGLKEYDIRIRGDVVTTTVKTAVGLCATESQIQGSLPGNSPTTVAGTVVSVLFFYDESTAAAADQLTVEAYGIAVVENGNLVLQNSGVANLRWRYAGAVKVAGYTSTGNTQTDLAAMANSTSTLGAFVLQKSNELIADQALLIFNAFQTGGASGRAERPGHNSTVYWQAPWFVYIHQLGHNFGCHHDRAFDLAADGNGQFSYGFAWTKPFTGPVAGVSTTIQVGYGTIMSFWGLDFIQPYFSTASVSITYVGNHGTSQEFIETRAIGVAADQPKAADNARTMREAALAMSGYRVVAGGPTTPPVVTPPVVTPPATPSNRGGGGGAPSLWFLLALSGLAAFHRKFARK